MLDAIWNGIVYFFSLLWPYTSERAAGGVTRGLRIVLHLVLLAIILIGLFFLNRYLKIDELIPRPVWAQPIWLPLLFLLLYFLGVLGWWIYRLLMAEGEGTDFPDIDDAWDEAVANLDQAGISLAGVPIFLVLGRPEAPEEVFFQAAQLGLVLKGVPVGSKHPLHVYANRDVIFITCAGCSLLGKQASLLALEGIGDDAGDPGAPAPGMMGDDAAATLKPGEAEQKIIKKLARIVGTNMTGLQKRALRRESNLPLPNLLNNSAEVEHHMARLAHFCRLLFRDRQPYCPINGILVMVPLGATDTEINAQQSAELCRRDLSVVRRVLKVQCPIFAVLADVEQLPGFTDFIKRRSSSERARRIGQRFPLNPPDLDGDALLEKIDESAQWLCQHVVRDLVYRVFQVETGSTARLSANHDLFLLLDELRERKDHLARFLVQGIARDVDGPLLFGGCYLAGTGADRDREQAFGRGVLQRLLDNQNYVSWTDQAVSDDARARRVSLFGYAFLVLLVAVITGAFGYRWWESKHGG